MKIKYTFEKMELDGDIVAVPVGENSDDFHAVINLNETAMRIIELLREETTEEKVVDQLLKEYDGNEQEIKALVHSFINELRREGLLIEQ